MWAAWQGPQLVGEGVESDAFACGSPCCIDEAALLRRTQVVVVAAVLGRASSHTCPFPPRHSDHMGYLDHNQTEPSDYWRGSPCKDRHGSGSQLGPGQRTDLVRAGPGPEGAGSRHGRRPGHNGGRPEWRFSAVVRAATVDDKTAAVAAPLRARNPAEEGADGAAKLGEGSIGGGEVDEEGVDAAVEEVGVAAGTDAVPNTGAVAGIVARIDLVVEVGAGAAAAAIAEGDHRSAVRDRSWKLSQKEQDRRRRSSRSRRPLNPSSPGLSRQKSRPQCCKTESERRKYHHRVDRLELLKTGHA